MLRQTDGGGKSRLLCRLEGAAKAVFLGATAEIVASFPPETRPHRRLDRSSPLGPLRGIVVCPSAVAEGNGAREREQGQSSRVHFVGGVRQTIIGHSTIMTLGTGTWARDPRCDGTCALLIKHTAATSESRFRGCGSKVESGAVMLDAAGPETRFNVCFALTVSVRDNSKDTRTRCLTAAVQQCADQRVLDTPGVVRCHRVWIVCGLITSLARCWE